MPTRTIILASNSPRRTQLLSDAGIPHIVFASDVDESLTFDLQQHPESACQALAERKASAARESYFAQLTEDSTRAANSSSTAHPADTGSLDPDSYLFIGSDTMVVEGGEIFGKPTDRADAKRMLQRLSGVTHQVMTSVSLQEVDFFEPEQADAISNHPGHIGTRPHTTRVTTTNFVDISLVTFYTLSDEDIESYLDTGESFGKAGAYAIQGIGARLVSHVEGDLDTVIGLPVDRLLRDYPEFFREPDLH